MRVLTVLPVVLLLCACGGGPKREDFVGSYVGKVGMTYASMQNEAEGDSEQATFLAEQLTSQKSISLTLSEDGSASFDAGRPIQGTWAFEGGAVVLTLPSATTPAGGPAFGGTYRLEPAGEGMIEGADPQVEGFSLNFTKSG